MINEILYQLGLGLDDHVCLQFKYLCYAEKCNRPTPRFKLILTSFKRLLNSVEWDEALRDLDTNSAWTYFSSKFNRFLKESIPMLVQKKKEKSLMKLKTKETKDTQDITIPL